LRLGLHFEQHSIENNKYKYLVAPSDNSLLLLYVLSDEMLFLGSKKFRNMIENTGGVYNKLTINLIYYGEKKP